MVRAGFTRHELIGKGRLRRFDAHHFLRILQFARFDRGRLEHIANGKKHFTFWSPKTARYVTVPVGLHDIATPVARYVLNEVGISPEYLHEILLDVQGY